MARTPLESFAANLLGAWGRKDNPVGQLLVQFTGANRPVYTSRDYNQLAKQGFENNVFVYRAVMTIATAVAGIEWQLYPKGKHHPDPIEDHPLLDLLTNPNPEQGKSEFMEALVAYWVLAGNSYLHAIQPDQSRPPLELWVLRPDRMRVVPDDLGRVANFEYVYGSKKQIVPGPACMHLKMFAASDDWYGISPVQVAARIVDQVNAGNDWNTALLQNAARPSGALVAQGVLNDNQFSRLEALLKDAYRGPKNAGKPMLLEGGLDFKQIQLSPSEMDWLAGKKEGAREIAIALGVPPEMLGDSANKTYSNYQEARTSFYQETVLPLLDKLRDRLNAFLVPMFDARLRLDYDRNSIEALAEDREKVYRRVADGFRYGLFSLNQALGLIGEDQVDDKYDVRLVPNNMVTLDSVLAGPAPAVGGQTLPGTPPAPVGQHLPPAAGGQPNSSPAPTTQHSTPAPGGQPAPAKGQQYPQSTDIGKSVVIADLVERRMAGSDLDRTGSGVAHSGMINRTGAVLELLSAHSRMDELPGPEQDRAGTKQYSDPAASTSEQQQTPSGNAGHALDKSSGSTEIEQGSGEQRPPFVTRHSI